MKLPALLKNRAWLLVPLLGCCFLFWADRTAVRRIDYVTAVGRDPGARVAGVPRELIVPEHINRSYGWIVETQQMLARGDWRLRQVAHENVPYGRDVHSASPYRWWLGLVAWVHHAVTGGNLADSVERAALDADPLLHALLLLVGSALVARRFGAFPAALLAVATVALFPFAAGFQPGVPDDFALLLVLVPTSVLAFLGALAASANVPASAGRRFFAAGAVGGVALWISVPGQLPVLLGLGLGGMILATVSRRLDGTGGPVPDWRAWALGGATVVLAAYLLEYFPSHLGGWELRAIHPLYALAWLGAGELLARVAAFARGGQPAWRVKDYVIVGLALAAVAAVPVAMSRTGNPGALAVDLLSYRLTKQPDGIMAPNLAVWFKLKGVGPAGWATLLPLLLLAVAAAATLRRPIPPLPRALLALALGPLLVAVSLAYLYLRWWQVLGALLLPAIVAVAWATTRPQRRWAWAGLVALAVGPGLTQLAPSPGAVDNNVLSVADVEGLVERDLAQWLARHTDNEGGPVVLAPPSLTSSLYYYGGIRGLGTLAWENKDGLAVTLRVAISTTQEEARTLMRQRGVTHIILPTWDDFFDPYTQAASVQTNELFFLGLSRWTLPPWLRPVPYHLPNVAGFENQSVRILELVDDQDEPAAASRLTEYFVEMGQLDNAQMAAQRLARYPADFGVLVARAQLAAALADGEAFLAAFNPLLQRLASGADRRLAWDRRVSLAIVLARGKRLDLARGQVQRCFNELSARRLRTLPTTTLFQLLVLAKAVDVEIADAQWRQLAHDLLPEELRQQLAARGPG